MICIYCCVQDIRHYCDKSSRLVEFVLSWPIWHTFPIFSTTQAGILIVEFTFWAPLSRKGLIEIRPRTILMSLIMDFTKLLDVYYVPETSLHPRTFLDNNESQGRYFLVFWETSTPHCSAHQRGQTEILSACWSIYELDHNQWSWNLSCFFYNKNILLEACKQSWVCEYGKPPWNVIHSSTQRIVLEGNVVTGMIDDRHQTQDCDRLFSVDILMLLTVVICSR